METEQKSFRSLILKYFPTELLIGMEKITRSTHLYDNNQKGKEMLKLLNEYEVPYDDLGSGTNRYGILIDGYAVKIALDTMGKTDNKREFKYSKRLYPSVTKVYETNSIGLLGVNEYVSVFTLDDFYARQEEMREILSEISPNFLIGDIGVSARNYINWGKRNDDSICVYDFAYIYALSYKQFKCYCAEGSIVEYDNDCNDLVCPTCRRKYSFGEIRKNITKADEEAEIGDIMQDGYILSSQEQILSVDPDKSIDKIMGIRSKKHKKVKDKQEIEIPKMRNFDLTIEEQLKLLQ